MLHDVQQLPGAVQACTLAAVAIAHSQELWYA